MGTLTSHWMFPRRRPGAWKLASQGQLQDIRLPSHGSLESENLGGEKSRNATETVNPENPHERQACGRPWPPPGVTEIRPRAQTLCSGLKGERTLKLVPPPEGGTFTQASFGTMGKGKLRFPP